MNKQDYYVVLGLDKTATDDDIKKAYRKLAMKYHPDRETGDESKFKEAKEAYEVLSDPNKKSQYDQFGHTMENNPFGHQPGSKTWTFNDQAEIHEIFQEIFKNNGFNTGFRQQRQRIHLIKLTLEEAYKGMKIKLEGTNQEVNISPGIRSGTTFTYDNKIYRIDVQPHPKFKRSNDDLLIDIELTAIEVMLGLDITVEHLDGSKLQFNIKPGLQPGQIIKLNSKGMKNSEFNRYGDLLVRISIVMPTELTDKQKQALKEFNYRSNINL